jgi:hypothetical protein
MAKIEFGRTDKVKSQLVFGVAGAALGLVVWGCSSPASPYPDVTSFCSAKAKAICQAAAICAVDVNACQGNQVTVCQKDATAATALGTRKYDSNGAGTCIDALNGAFGGGASKVTFTQLIGAGSITDKCERVFSGSAAMNQHCETDYDCSGTLICSPVAPGSTSRVCATATPVNQGDFCANPGSQCQDSHCVVQEGGAPQCEPLAMAGETCGELDPCVSGQRCVNGLCQMALPGGGQCATNGDCVAEDPYCDPYAGSICTVGLTFATGATDCKGFLLGQNVNGGAGGGSDASPGD